MNYKESKKILSEIKKAKKILVNCHYAPDYDSIAACVSIYQVIKKFGKRIDMFSPTPLMKETRFMKDVNKIKIHKFNDLDLASYDLLIILDSQEWSMATGDEKLAIPDVKIIKIDHHPPISDYGQINLVDEKASSACEVIYHLITDWGEDIDNNLATKLLTGIVGDTGGFQYSNTKPRTFKVAGKLMELGADHNEIIYRLFRSISPDTLKLWAEYLKNIKVEEKNRFAWTAVDYRTFKKFKGTRKVNSTIASLFIRVIDNTDFGITMTEYEKRKLSISFRERDGYDVYAIAKKFDGGGHKASAGAEIHGMPFDEAVKTILAEVRKHVNKGNK
jgi:phosphoesterase RecJ-like protein